MNGRYLRAIVGVVVFCGSVVSFVLSAALGTVITWQSVAMHTVMLVTGLLLIDHKLGVEVLNKLLRKVDTHRRHDD